MTLEESLRSLSLDYLNLLINGQAFSDVTFSVEGRLVHAHRCILAARSLFFRKFFCGPETPAGLDMSRIGAAGGGLASSPRGSNPPQKQLASMVEKASIEDVMKVLIASRKQEMHQLWTTCSHLVAKSGLAPEVLARHLPIEVVTKIEELRLKSSLARRSLMPHHHHHDLGAAAELEDQKIRRMRRALDSSDVELVKLMVMGEGLNLDEALALHYAVENCSREVVKALLELGAADVNYPAGLAGKTPLHIASEMVSPDMVAVLLDHHADPNVRTVEGITPLDVLRTLTSDFLFKGAVPGLTHIEPNKLRLCLELVQSAALVISREEGSGNAPSSTPIYPPMSDDHNSSSSSGNMANLNLDSRLVYLNLGAAQMGCKMDEGDDSNSHNNNQREAMNRHGSQGGGGGGGCNDPSIYHHHHSHEY
ncbi:BTB/POZ domain and ankyrin repeat-containing protein NPR5 isoform X2 [Camellia sinensis]|uniref:BTB/POZ domain and ankyrin repeat-containing protein NPR5 isoform X2 n=1 Tax=Camellia sinensis TaxID=4442 RepID=UPI001036B5E7|nr:BTB/POZ domain and ankyrin repeat-containing protein NPR5 isoform X2 [Camellia sinensis]